MTTTNSRSPSEGLLKTQVFERLKRLGEEDRKAVADLLQNFLDAPEDREEIMEVLWEVIFPDSMFVGAEVDTSVDPAVQSGFDEYQRKIGDVIRRRRQTLNMTQGQLAEAAGIPQSHVSRLERGVHVPTHLTIKKVAKALGVNPSQLDPGLDDEDD